MPPWWSTPAPVICCDCDSCTRSALALRCLLRQTSQVTRASAITPTATPTPAPMAVPRSLERPCGDTAAAVLDVWAGEVVETLEAGDAEPASVGAADSWSQ